MANTQNISSLVTVGEASAGPPLGPALGPMGVNIMEVIKAINEKTNDFKGMKVPVTVIVASDTKKWQIEILPTNDFIGNGRRFYGFTFMVYYHSR